MARWYLASHGLTVLSTNVRVGRGEIDILARDRGVLVSIEVRTRVGGGDPADAADPAKRSRAERLGRAAGARRFDVVGVAIDRDGFEVHWVPSAS